MTVATINAVYTSLYLDGLNGGLGVTTDATPAAGDWLVFCTMGSNQAETMTAPAGFTEVLVPDNLIATAGGQIRAYFMKNPAASTTYVITATGPGTTRRAAIGLLVRLADPTTFLDVKSSLESAPGASHAGPALTTTGADRLMISFAGIRQFPPDPSTGWTAPAGWTLKSNIISTDANNNISLGAAVIAAPTAGLVNETWTQADTFEDAIVITMAVVPASTGGGAVTLADLAGGGAAGGSTGSESITTVLSDLPAGGAGAGDVGPEGATVGLADLPAGGAGAGGRLEAITTVLGDPAGGGAGAGGSGPEQAGSSLSDVLGGGSGAGGTPLGITTVLADVAGGGAGTGGTLESSSGGPNPVTLADVPGGGAGAGGTIEVPASGTVIHDMMVMPVLNAAKACLKGLSSVWPNAPAKYQLRTGNAFTASADNTFDECCSGIAWVRGGVRYPTENFPVQKTTVGDGVETDWAVMLEFGVQRCIPTQGDDGVYGSVVTEGQWDAATQQEEDDASMLRKAACCLRDGYHYSNGLVMGYRGMIIGVETPLENSGPCGGIMLAVTIRVPACDCY